MSLLTEKVPGRNYYTRTSDLSVLGIYEATAHGRKQIYAPRLHLKVVDPPRPGIASHQIVGTVKIRKIFKVFDIIVNVYVN